jgi:hypothetical protein
MAAHPDFLFDGPAKAKTMITLARSIRVPLMSQLNWWQARQCRGQAVVRRGSGSVPWPGYGT